MISSVVEVENEDIELCNAAVILTNIFESLI